jgi:hypothetical protein
MSPQIRKQRHNKTLTINGLLKLMGNTGVDVSKITVAEDEAGEQQWGLGTL